MKRTSETDFWEPGEVFRKMWETAPDEPVRSRGRLSCAAAERMADAYTRSLSEQEFQRVIDELDVELDVKAVYYACFLELLHTQQEAADPELLSRIRRNRSFKEHLL